MAAASGTPTWARSVAEMRAPVVPVPRPGLPADFDIETYLHATLRKRCMMIDGAMGTMVQKHK